MTNWSELLYKALASDKGVVVEVSSADDVAYARSKLYEARRTDPDLLALSITTSPTEATHLWIVKKEQNNGSE